jgi:hypothetical protein
MNCAQVQENPPELDETGPDENPFVDPILLGMMLFVGTLIAVRFR